MGRLAPPCSVFFEASLTIISRIEFRIRLPGGASQYCLRAMLAKPFTPPK